MGESNGTEAFRTQGKARLSIEGQSLGRSRLLPKSQPRGAQALIHSFLEKSELEPARIGDLTHPVQPRGHLQKHIPKARLGGLCEGICCLFSPFCIFSASPPFPLVLRCHGCGVSALWCVDSSHLQSSLHSIPSCTPLSPPPRSILLRRPLSLRSLTPSAPPSPPSPSSSPPSPAR